MTTEPEIRIGRPEDFDLDSETITVRMREAERNNDYFLAHSDELFKQYPDKWILVHSGGVVEAFDDFLGLYNRRKQLDRVTSAGSMHYIRRPGVWLL